MTSLSFRPIRSPFHDDAHEDIVTRINSETGSLTMYSGGDSEDWLEMTERDWIKLKTFVDLEFSHRFHEGIEKQKTQPG